VERLILDTGALIALEPGIADAADERHRARRETIVEGITSRVEIVAYDLDVSRHHAALLAHARRAGQPRGAHDLQIAATARATDRVLITTDATAFNDLSGVTHRVLR
jgi:tRNA(fMet)-specific endonuclease VapC